MSLLRSAYRSVQRLAYRLMKRSADQRTLEIIHALSHVPLFRELNRNALHELAEITHQRTYRREEFLYYENDPGMGLYIVQSGSVRLLIEDEQGTMQELRQLGEWDVFGELSLLDSFRRMETAQAVTDTTVLGFFRPDLNVLRMRNPHVGALVTMALARFLARRQVEMVDMLGEEFGQFEAMKRLSTATSEVFDSRLPVHNEG